jgi:hypothetical protein
MMFAENLDEEDQAWLSTYRMPGAELVEGFVGVIVWMDAEGVRKWRPICGIQAATVDSIMGIWTMAGLQLGAGFLEGGSQIYEDDDDDDE